MRQFCIWTTHRKRIHCYLSGTGTADPVFCWVQGFLLSPRWRRWQLKPSRRHTCNQLPSRLYLSCCQQVTKIGSLSLLSGWYADTIVDTIFGITLPVDYTYLSGSLCFSQMLPCPVVWRFAFCSPSPPSRIPAPYLALVKPLSSGGELFVVVNSLFVKIKTFDFVIRLCGLLLSPICLVLTLLPLVMEHGPIRKHSYVQP